MSDERVRHAGPAGAPRCVVTHRVFDETLHHLASAARVTANAAGEPWPDALRAELLADASAAITFMPDRVDDAWLAQAPGLRIIAGALKGYDNIDVAAATARGVWVSIVPDHLTVPTAELAIGLTLGLARHVAQADREVRAGAFGGWRARLYGLGLEDTTVGLIGLGRVGQAIATRLSAFGCRLLATDPAEGSGPWPEGVVRVELDALLADSGVVIVCAPLLDSTLHLIDEAALARMRPGALLVNIARGSVVDEGAVADALEGGRLGGFAADVFEFEDWARVDRPLEIAPRLLALGDRTLFTPHLGSATVAARQRIERAAADNVRAVLRGGRPPDAGNDL